MIERMLDESETAALRSLQERAYGRNGGLTSQEAARLHELESKLRPMAVAAPVVSAEHSTSAGLGIRSERGAISAAAPVEAFEEPEPEPELDADPAPPEPPRKRARLVFAGVAALLIGLAVGWAIWGWNSAEFALAATHAEQRAELEASGDFDPGTVVALSEKHSVVIWRAERHEGDQLCVITTTPQQTQSGCADPESSSLGTANVSATVPEDDELAGQMLNAFLLESANGEIVPFVQVWEQNNSGWESQFSEGELEAIGRLEAEGYDARSFNILGYDGDRPVWTSWGTEMCVIVESDDGIVEGCSSNNEAPPTESVVTASIDGVQTQYIVRQTETRGHQLTVVKLPEVTTVEVGEGEQIEIDDKTGDVIE